MNSFTFLIVLTIAAVGMAGVVQPSGKNFGLIAPKANLTLIGEGEIDGKFFYSEPEERTWFEAGEMCQENGMQLATLTSLEQFEYLKSSFTVDFAGSHWMAGRDAQELRQFTWNAIGIPPSEFFVEFGGVDIPYQLCLTFWSVAMLSRSQAEFCTDKFPTMCEIPASH